MFQPGSSHREGNPSRGQVVPVRQWNIGENGGSPGRLTRLEMELGCQCGSQDSPSISVYDDSESSSLSPHAKIAFRAAT